MHGTPFLYLSLIFLSAFFMKILSRKIKIPEVTGYVIIGVLLGVSLLRILSPETLHNLSAISTVALGIIAFIIGSELRLSTIRKLGKSILFIVVFECLTAFAVVYGVLLALVPDKPYMALLLGAVASATAPAATVAVIKQYRTRGELTSTIMAVVGIDDALALVIYVVASGFAKAGLQGQELHILHILGQVGLSIGESLLIGIAAAFLYRRLLSHFFRESEWIEILLAAAVLGILGISEFLGNSELLAVMVFASVVANTAPTLSKRSGQVIDSFSPIFLAAFFILGGAHLDTRVITDIGLIGLVYFLARSAGKIGGASLGAFIGRAPKKVRGRIGFTLLPQVGVALALALSINREFTRPMYGQGGAEMAHYIINILLFTTIITEVVGPLLTRYQLRRAGEIDPERVTQEV
jgi:Kef-type K+ transport system membrane component KefB